MGDDHDNGDGNDERRTPPAVSRLGRTGNRSYRTLNRTASRYRGRDRFPRLRKQLPIVELLGRLIKHHKLTDEVRQRIVCLYWTEIVGERIASKTFPVSFTKGVLQVSTSTSSWANEMQFLKRQLITKIHDWIEANKVWLGPPPLVTDMRFALAMRMRESLVDQEHAARLRLEYALRTRPRVEAKPPIVSDAERDAIRTETSHIRDAELRAVVESVRMKWNR